MAESRDKLLREKSLLWENSIWVVAATPSGEYRTPAAEGTITLPSWFPRVPLEDVPVVLRAVQLERARLVRLAERDGEKTEGQVPRDQRVLDQALPVSGPSLEHDVPVTPYPAVRTEKFLPPSVDRVSKTIWDVANQNTEGEFLPPQKKLLNSIDTVSIMVREELQRLERTTSANKAERERRVRTLMSMR